MTRSIMPNFLTKYINPANFTFGISEGEKDNNLSRCFIKTESINIFVNNIQSKNFVVAPKGLGKSGLCSIITDPQNVLLPNRNHYFYINSIHCEQTVEFCSDINRLKYNIISHVYSVTINHLLKYYDDGISSPINDLRKLMSKKLTLESVTAKGGLTVGGLIGDLTGKWVMSDREINNTYAEIFENIENVLTSKNKKLIICIDNLDDITKRMDLEKKKQVLSAFYDSVQLMRKWGDSANPSILPVLFIRDDLFRYIDREGESDKRSLITELSWNRYEITKFIVKRFLANDLLNDIRKEIKLTALKQGRIRSFFINKKDLSWIDNLSHEQVFDIFNVFFALNINGQTFYDWITKTLCDSDNVFNPRTIIDFFDLLLKFQYSEFDERGIDKICYEKGSYNIISEDSVLKAFHKLQLHKIDDYVDLIIVGDKSKNEIKRVFEHIIITLNRKHTINAIQYDKFGFTEFEFHMLIDEMEFYKIIKSYQGKPMYQKYILAPIMRGYSKN